MEAHEYAFYERTGLTEAEFGCGCLFFVLIIFFVGSFTVTLFSEDKIIFFGMVFVTVAVTWSIKCFIRRKRKYIWKERLRKKDLWINEQSADEENIENGGNKLGQFDEEHDKNLYLIEQGMEQAKGAKIQCLQAYNLLEGGWLLVEKVVFEPNEKVYLRILKDGKCTDSWYEFVYYDKKHDGGDYIFGEIQHDDKPYRYFRFRDDCYVLNDRVTMAVVNSNEDRETTGNVKKRRGRRR